MKRRRFRERTLVAILYGFTLSLYGDPVEHPNLTVSALCNIYGAGLPRVEPMPSPSGGGGGVPPVAVALPNTAKQVITISQVTGQIRFSPSSKPNGPEGGPWAYHVGSYRGLSEFRAPVSACLVGVFLGKDLPSGEAPEELNFFEGENIEFVSLSPMVGQVFFIGDGRTKGGVVQQFQVPSGATQLFLGFADAYHGGAKPGFYGDNAGEVVVSLKVSTSDLEFPELP